MEAHTSCAHRRSQAYIAVLFWGFVASAVGCSGSGGGGTSISRDRATVGPEGGIVEASIPGVSSRARIEIPPSALLAETEITIAPSAGPPFDSRPDAANVTIRIGPPGTLFAVPATVTIPYANETDENELAAFVAQDDSDAWEYLPQASISTSSNRAVFETSHLSHFKVAPLPHPEPGTSASYYLLPTSNGAAPSDVEVAIGNQTIQQVVRSGAIRDLADRLCVTLVPTTDVRSADLRVLWQELAPSPVTGEERPAAYFPGAAGSTIILNANLAARFHFDIGLPNPSAQLLDLYSIAAHELSHFLGVPSQRDPSYPEDGLFDDHIARGEIARTLVGVDESVFHAIFPPVEFLDHSPTGSVADPRPIVSVGIRATCEFDGGLVRMLLDNMPVSPRSFVTDDRSGVIDFEPPFELTRGTHSVHVTYPLPDGELEKRWTFELDRSADFPGDGECVNISGDWSWESACSSDACGPESDRGAAQISQEGCSVTVTADFRRYEGTVSGRMVVLRGQYPEDGGITDETVELQLAADLRTFSGSSSWTWSGSFTCTGTCRISGEFLR